MSWLAVALGGAFGAMARYALNGWLFRITTHPFPFGTLTVNVVGSFLMGICYVLIVDKGVFPALSRELVMVGFLGAFTTFSTFSLDALALWQNGHLLLALSYVLTNVVLCLFAIALSIWLTRALF